MTGLADARWVNDVVLADGTTACVRPISPEDGPALVAFHGRQSSESIYFRFFSPRPHLSDQEVAHFTNVDGLNRMAFVAERGGELVGVARYDVLVGQEVAEAAFFTDEDMKGKGIATLLLEYLAAYARELGIHHFTAHVLPENRRMARVFRQAGFETTSAFADGAVEFVLDIDPTPEAAEAMAQRARHSERESVVRLLEPRSVVVIGAGRAPGGIGHRVLRNLLAGPFEGPVHVVHPEATAVAGVRAHPTLVDVPDIVDLAIIAVPAPDVIPVIDDCGRSGVGAVVVISAGFAETGVEGAQLQHELLATARRFGTRVLGPNCLGVINTDPSVRLHATFAEVAVRPGRVGLLSQSGTLGAVILEVADRMGIGISTFVAVGNKADLSGNDLLQYWLDDERTDVVLLYLESFGNPRRFGRNVREVAVRKPVFAVRAGAALDVDEDAHGWLDDLTVDAFLRQTGVVRVPTVKALLDAALVASAQPSPSGGGVAVVGNAGGSLSMAADACVAAGLELVELSTGTVAAIDPIRLHGRRRANPVELPYDASPTDYEHAVSSVLVDPAVDLALVVYAPYDRDGVAPLEQALDRVASAHPTATVVACVYGSHPEHTTGGVPIFDFPDDAAFALGAVVRHADWVRSHGAGDIRSLDDATAARALVDVWLRRRTDRTTGVTLAPEDARALLEAAGIRTVPIAVLHTSDDLHQIGADLVGPFALKAEAHRVGATTRAMGVALDLDDLSDVGQAMDQISAALAGDAWPMILQPMVVSGTDVRVEVRTHPVVGPVLTLGPGGGAGRYAPTTSQVLPLTGDGARRLVTESGMAEELSPAAADELTELCTHLAALVEAVPEITELRCDPVIVRGDATDVIEVHVELEPIRSTQPPDVRRV